VWQAVGSFWGERERERERERETICGLYAGLAVAKRDVMVTLQPTMTACTLATKSTPLGSAHIHAVFRISWSSVFVGVCWQVIGVPVPVLSKKPTSVPTSRSSLHCSGGQRLILFEPSFICSLLRFRILHSYHVDIIIKQRWGLIQWKCVGYAPPPLPFPQTVLLPTEQQLSKSRNNLSAMPKHGTASGLWPP